jgi:cellulose synthase/poly-beta-1,6-N-acetylglucosamine synthase-like glycosyltransferase
VSSPDLTRGTTLAPRAEIPSEHRAVPTTCDSARQTLSRGQARVAALAAAALVVGLAVDAILVARIVLAGLTGAFLLVASLRCAYAVRGLRAASQPAPDLADEELPHYTVIVALYREEAVVEHLARALSDLDYPSDRKQVILACEAGDELTIAACTRHAERDWHVLVVPPGHPRTKPRALNAALPFVRGTLLTLYDAEDRPDRLQLRRAAAEFAAAGPDLAALQARLDVYNERQNIVTRCFTLDYLTLFGAVLPGLASFGHPMPLGGTSTHLRTDVMRHIGGWDAWNVTEDCDLGMRLAEHGFSSQTLDSVTWEEAVPSPRGWLRQRSRWVKGYAQTALVMLRRPFATARRMGWRNYSAALITVGGLPVVLLAQVVMWLLLVAFLVVRTATGDSEWLKPVFPEPLGSLSFLALVGGTFSVLVMHAAVAHRRARYELVRYVPLLPLYLLAASLAAYRGCAQLVRRPHHWEKTTHDASHDDPSVTAAVAPFDRAAADPMRLPTAAAPPAASRVALRERRVPAAALAALAGTGLALAGALALSWGRLLDFSDAPSHLVTPRRVFDNVAPGIDQLGLHWLPLYHVLELPFIWIDPLYRTGLAGSIVSVFGALATTLFLYLLAGRCGASPGRALGVCLALIAAPSFLYVGVVPMHYTVITATSVASIYYLACWVEGRRPQDLLLCSLALTAATLTHFESWILVPLEALVIIACSRSATRAQLQGDLGLWAIAGCFGVVGFFALNVWWAGEPLSFLYGFAGSGNVVASSEVGWHRLGDHPLAAWTVAGPLLTLAGVAGGVLCALRWKAQPARLVSLLLFAPLLFFAAQAVTTGSIIEPDAELTDWRNLRYGVTLLPALAFFAAMAPKRDMVVWGLLTLIAVAGAREVVQGRVAAEQDARYDVPLATVIERGGRWLQSAGEGRILLPRHSPQQDRFQLQSGLPSTRFIDDNDAALLAEVLDRPDRLTSLGVRWIVTLRPADRRASAAKPPRRLLDGGASECAVFNDGRGRPVVRIWGLGGCS